MKCFLCMHGEIYSPKTLYKIKKLKKIIYKDRDIDSEDFKKRYEYLLKKLGDIDEQIILIVIFTYICSNISSNYISIFTCCFIIFC